MCYFTQGLLQWVPVSWPRLLSPGSLTGSRAGSRWVPTTSSVPTAPSRLHHLLGGATGQRQVSPTKHIVLGSLGLGVGGSHSSDGEG